ncbi:MAG: thiosulfate oxidation carrier complex protein SoxZ [Candidatus Omnitrophica bacterium]|nr:thiosulfate oxidation carrier complex protein SoxZ [Candidatus Omnitrophota bacterium]
MKNIFVFILFFSFTMMCSDAYAHPPSDIKIEHSSASRMLTAIVTHSVSDPVKHFISKIDIWLNGKEVISHEISRQDNEKYQFAGYLIPDAKPGDTISVEAYCSISGKLRKDIKVK